MEMKPGYKQTELGVIPAEWETKSFQEIGRMAKGKGLLKDDIKRSGAIPAIPYTALYTDFSELINYDDIKWFVDEDAQTFIATEPCLLIASSSNMEANTGKASALTGNTPVAVGREVIVFTTPNDCRYLSYLLSTPLYRRKTLSLARGTTIKHVYPATYFNFRVAIPPRKEQSAIADALGDVDALLASMERLIAKKRDIKQAAMQQFITGQTRLPEFEANSGVQLSEWGAIPSDWEAPTLDSIIDEISMGPFGSDITVSNFTSEGIPVLSGANVATQRLVDSFNNFVSLSKAKSLKKAVANRGDIVVTHRGTIGQISYIPNDSEFERYVVSQSQFRVRFSKDAVIPAWVVLYFHSTHGSAKLLEKKGHTGVPAIAQPTTTFRMLRIPLPSVAEQKAIVAVIDDMDAEIKVLESRRDKTRALKRAMMQELLTGKTRLI